MSISSPATRGHYYCVIPAFELMMILSVMRVSEITVITHM